MSTRTASMLDFSLYDEKGTVLEIEVGSDRVIINICQTNSRSSMFITKDRAKIRRIRDALTRIIESDKK